MEKGKNEEERCESYLLLMFPYLSTLPTGSWFLYVRLFMLFIHSCCQETHHLPVLADAQDGRPVHLEPLG